MQLRRVPIVLTLLAAFLFLADGCHHATRALVAPPSPLQSPSGKTYTRTHAGPADNDEPVNTSLLPGAASGGDNYQGTARRAAKLSIVAGTAQYYNDLGALLDSLIPDAQMRALHISTGPDSGRVAQEQKVVTVTAFLYAASRESDNDFHCIVGRGTGTTARYMNVEVTALPPSSSPFFAALSTARNQFKTFFGAGGLPSGGYDKYNPPIPIKVTGSLFFDVDHVPPAVGPTGMKPKSAWEIHPVSDIQFEP